MDSVLGGRFLPRGAALTQMIDRLKKIASSLQFLRIPSIVLGLVSLVLMIAITVGSTTHEEDYYLIPSVVGLVWSMITYSFLVNFDSVPNKSDSSWKLFDRLKRNVVRAEYWFLGAVFILATLGAILVSYRMVIIWLRDFSG